MITWKRLRRLVLPSEAKHNFRFGVINGVCFSLAETLVDASLVLALFVRELGGSTLLVGLLPSLKNGGFLLPQLLVAGRITGMSRMMPLYRRAAIARTVAFLCLMLIMFAATVLPVAMTLTLFVVAYSAYNLTGGSSSLAFQDIVAKTIPPRQRGTFFGYRQLMGGLLAFAIAAPLVRTLLADDGPVPFPFNYGALATIALLLIAGGLAAFSMIDEPPLAKVGTPHSIGDTLRSVPHLFRTEIDLRRFVVSRLLARAGAIAEPFYILYAREALGIAPRYVGIYLAVRVLSAALSNILWGRVADREGNRRLLMRTSAIAALVPVAALAVPWAFAPGSAPLAWSFALVFLCIGFSIDGSGTASTTYLLEISPDTERPTYAGVANTVLGVATFLPVFGGWVLTVTGQNYVLLLALGAVFSAIAWAATVRLREPRDVRADMQVAAALVRARG
jgi:MFS family permease